MKHVVCRKCHVVSIGGDTGRLPILPSVEVYPAKSSVQVVGKGHVFVRKQRWPDKVDCIIDSGASHSCMPLRLLLSIGAKPDYIPRKDHNSSMIRYGPNGLETCMKADIEEVWKVRIKLPTGHAMTLDVWAHDISGYRFGVLGQDALAVFPVLLCCHQIPMQLFIPRHIEELRSLWAKICRW